MPATFALARVLLHQAAWPSDVFNTVGRQKQIDVRQHFSHSHCLGLEFPHAGKPLLPDHTCQSYRLDNFMGRSGCHQMGTRDPDRLLCLFQ